MSDQIHPAFSAASESVDTRALSEQLGSADELTTLTPIASRHLTRIHSLPALREFLLHYKDEVLGPHEFHQIYQAFNYANQNFVRELLELDATLANKSPIEEFQLASRSVGKRQLNRMRNLKDLRTVQRYRDAVNDGKAYGWHTLVYGIVLSTYSLPLRQGLLHYGRQTLGGFIDAAARALDLSDEVSLRLQVEMNTAIPPLIESTVLANGCALKLIP
jgi:urease accessory protein UreF